MPDLYQDNKDNTKSQTIWVQDLFITFHLSLKNKLMGRLDMNFNDLKKNLKKDYSALKEIKITLLGDSSTQLLVQCLRGYGYEVGLNLNIFEADYQQIDQQVFDASSDLYQIQSDFVIIFQSAEKLQKQFYNKSEGQVTFANFQIQKLTNMCQAIYDGSARARIIIFNFLEINDSVFGNYANKIESSLLYQMRMLNFQLMKAAKNMKNVFINDICALQSYHGRAMTMDSKNYINADIVFSLDFLPYVAKNTVDIILAVTGSFKKALILDLDNTLWGGIIGDDGLENIQVGDLGIGRAFTDLQLWVKQLRQRGIILAICSKNDQKIAQEPFEKHPEMILHLNDIAIFAANWDSKVDNIKYIQSILNIGFDSMVFLDDNPYERNVVRTYLPLVSVPELPEDPVDYLPYLTTLNLFETASFTEDDSKRTLQYQEESKRAEEQKSHTNVDDFLKSLKMTAEITEFNNFNIPRVAQLSLRSNQFNLRTSRYTGEEIEQISKDENYLHSAYNLKDKFGDYGLISVVILSKIPGSTTKDLFIDTWLMSCRVLKRGVENLVLNKLVVTARENGFERLIGEHLPTAKNGLVKDHYKNLGFTENNDLWILAVEGYVEKSHFISY